MQIDSKKARELMERSIEMMKSTVQEPRDDGKISPRVGAVLIMPDGTVKEACRGQYRHGEHAEHTLIERECHKIVLDGSILFTTLEPCTHVSRAHGKLGCSERIVNARISEVWVGIEDPDPNVDRKGIAYLEKYGIKVRLYDSDLQELIYKENKDFINQAKLRTSYASPEEPDKTILTMLEKPIESAKYDDLSNDALEAYRVKIKVGDSIKSTPFVDRLIHKKVLIKKDGKLIPTGNGILLFNDQPRDFFTQAGLLATIQYPNGKIEPKDFNAPLILIPQLFENWLKERLPVILDRGQMERKELINDFPITLVREALVNALVHRDYDKYPGAKCQVFIDKNTISIKSPGSPIQPITIEQMQNFNAPTISRNPLLHHIFEQIGLAEERGLGLKSFKDEAEKHRLPLPRYTLEGPYLVMTIYTSQESVIAVLPPKIRDALNKDELVGWQALASKIKITKSGYASLTGFDRYKAERHLKKFVELNLLTRTGKGPSTEYIVNRESPQ